MCARRITNGPARLEYATLADVIRNQAHTHEDTEGDASGAERKDRLKNGEDYQYSQNDDGNLAEAEGEVQYQRRHREQQAYGLGKPLGGA